VETCRLAGAGCSVVGLVPPDEALDSLGGNGATILASVPSYLGQLVAAARARGLGPADFPLLRNVIVGGEVLSPSLAAAAAETFGVPQVADVFAMTEVIPVTGRTCSQRHLHLDLNTGYVEHLDLETGERAAPGSLATLVVTPFFPYRECMPVFRYDTRDVVRTLPDAPLTCEMAGIPGTGQILGKADQVLRQGADVVTPRRLVEAIEALPTEPWPARYRAALDDGRIALTLPESSVAGFGLAATVAHFAERGLDVELGLVPDADSVALRPLRCDLRETTFVSRPALVGA
jgi:phenylacetate-CoA ligase